MDRVHRFDEIAVVEDHNGGDQPFDPCLLGLGSGREERAGVVACQREDEVLHVLRREGAVGLQILEDLGLGVAVLVIKSFHDERDR